MRSMRSMRGGFIFRNGGPSLKVHHGQCLNMDNQSQTLLSHGHGHGVFILATHPKGM